MNNIFTDSIVQATASARLAYAPLPIPLYQETLLPWISEAEIKLLHSNPSNSTKAWKHATFQGQSVLICDYEVQTVEAKVCLLVHLSIVSLLEHEYIPQLLGLVAKTKSGMVNILVFYHDYCNKTSYYIFRYN
jgi:hypothetical protein